MRKHIILQRRFGGMGVQKSHIKHVLNFVRNGVVGMGHKKQGGFLHSHSNQRSIKPLRFKL